MAGAPGRIVIGTLGRPHGVAGMLYARPTGPTLATLEVGERVWIRVGGRELEHVVAERAGAGDRQRIRFEGITTREAARELTGGVVLVEEGRRAPAGDPDTFFVSDLIGCDVYLGDERLGAVREVHPAPANDALEVDVPDGPLLIPFTADAVTRLDLAARRIEIRPDLLG